MQQRSPPSSHMRWFPLVCDVCMLLLAQPGERPRVQVGIAGTSAAVYCRHVSLAAHDHLHQPLRQSVLFKAVHCSNPRLHLLVSILQQLSF